MPPAEPIVQVRTISKTIDLPRKPDQISLRVFETPLVITNTRIPEIVRKIQSGDKAPLNHVCFTLDEYAEFDRNRNDQMAYIRQAEAYFRDIEKQVKKARETAPEN